VDEDIEIRSQELRMATSLIDSMTEDFDPDQYHDHYREALEELVAAKVEGHEVKAPKEPEAPEPTSLLDALQASLDAAGQDRKPAGERARSEAKRRPRGKKTA
jgi:DNA end-binding protein Ku